MRDGETNIRHEMRSPAVPAPVKVPWWTSCRLMLAIIGFLGFLNVYALRADLSVAIVCMVNHTALTHMENSTSFVNSTISSDDTCGLLESSKDEDGEFVWSRPTQGLVLGAFFWGYLVMQVPGGWIATKYGGKRVFGWCIFISAIATLLSPLAASVHYVFLMIVRIIIGIGTSVAFPAMHAMWGKWAPPLERSKLTAFTYAGAQVGNVVTFPIASLLCRYGFAGGWPSVFYVIGGGSLVWFVVWMLVVCDSPMEHQRITDAERFYIVNSLKHSATSSSKKLKTPWRSIFTSLPVYAIIVGNVFADWGAYTMMTGIPTYMKDVLKFDIASNGGYSALPHIMFWFNILIWNGGYSALPYIMFWFNILSWNGGYSALPYIMFWFIINVSGWLADFVRCRGCLSTTWTRRLFQATGQVVPAVMLIGLGFLSCEQSGIAIFLLTMGVGFTGPIFSGFVVNSVDIAPAYAGIIFGISNAIGSLTGFVAPVVNGILTDDGVNQGTQQQWLAVFFVTAAIYVIGATLSSCTFAVWDDGVNQGTQQQWLTVFFVTAAIYVIGAIFYVIFASGEIQPWARTDVGEEKEALRNGKGGGDHESVM